MSIENLMTAINQRSTSFFNSMTKGAGGAASEMAFRDIVLSGVGLINSKFDQELVLFVFINEGDQEFIMNQLFNMICAEVPDSEELVRKIKQLKSTTLVAPYFKGTRKLDQMLTQAGRLALINALLQRSASLRDSGNFIGCSKDTYTSHFKTLVDVVSDNLHSRLKRSERKIINNIFGRRES